MVPPMDTKSSLASLHLFPFHKLGLHFWLLPTAVTQSAILRISEFHYLELSYLPLFDVPPKWAWLPYLLLFVVPPTFIIFLFEQILLIFILCLRLNIPSLTFSLTGHFCLHKLFLLFLFCHTLKISLLQNVSVSLSSGQLIPISFLVQILLPFLFSPPARCLTKYFLPCNFLFLFFQSELTLVVLFFLWNTNIIPFFGFIKPTVTHVVKYMAWI